LHRGLQLQSSASANGVTRGSRRLSLARPCYRTVANAGGMTTDATPLFSCRTQRCETTISEKNISHRQVRSSSVHG
jgi:hypothetical protein